MYAAVADISDIVVEQAVLDIRRSFTALRLIIYACAVRSFIGSERTVHDFRAAVAAFAVVEDRTAFEASFIGDELAVNDLRLADAVVDGFVKHRCAFTCLVVGKSAVADGRAAAATVGSEIVPASTANFQEAGFIRAISHAAGDDEAIDDGIGAYVLRIDYGEGIIIAGCRANFAAEEGGVVGKYALVERRLKACKAAVERDAIIDDKSAVAVGVVGRVVSAGGNPDLIACFSALKGILYAVESIVPRSAIAVAACFHVDGFCI